MADNRNTARLDMYERQKAAAKAAPKDEPTRTFYKPRGGNPRYRRRKGRRR